MGKWPFFFCFLIATSSLAAESVKKSKALSKKMTSQKKVKKVHVQQETIQDSLDQAIDPGSEASREIASDKKILNQPQGTKAKYWKFSEEEYAPESSPDGKTEKMVIPKLGP